MSIISGTKVKINKWPYRDKIGVVSSVHYSAGIKGIGRGTSYLVEIGKELVECDEDEVEIIN